MTGGVSHVDSFDPKPKLFADHGKTVAIDEWQGRRGKFTRYLKKPHWGHRPYGQSGIEVSDLFPHIGSCVDDLCVIRSLKSDHTNHYEATLQMHTGSITFARPSIGSWVSYGLGTVNRNLPSFMVIAPQRPLRRRPDLGLRLPPRLPPGDAGRPRPRADRRHPPPAPLGLACRSWSSPGSGR